MNVREEYKKYCEEKGIPFESIESVKPYDESTLFCPAGMQKYKDTFSSTVCGITKANIQACIRMNDFDEIGDATHLLHFNMMGLFSFREMSVEQAIDFWMEFVEERLGLLVDNATVHPDKYNDWARYHHAHALPVGKDEECKWSDGEIGGYCTEFYIGGVEIGNIVNPLGTCIDVGFGLERLQAIIDNTPAKSKEQSLIDAIQVILDSGYKPGPKQQGYVLRKLLRALNKLGGTMDHPIFIAEQERAVKVWEKYERLRDKHPDKPKEWWYDTHGVDLEEVM
jgi:alanyl-tRNA synthetase